MEKTFYWASAHKPTTEQLAELTSQGEVKFLSSELQARINSCGTDRKELKALAHEVLEATEGSVIVQLGGSPMFLYIAGATINGCMNRNAILFAHSERVSVDNVQADGTIIKTSVFKHLGFI